MTNSCVLVQTAQAWVDAMDCHCEIDTSLFVQSLGGVIAEAATSVYSNKCAGTRSFPLYFLSCSVPADLTYTASSSECATCMFDSSPCTLPPALCVACA